MRQFFKKSWRITLPLLFLLVMVNIKPNTKEVCATYNECLPEITPTITTEPTWTPTPAIIIEEAQEAGPSATPTSTPAPQDPRDRNDNCENNPSHPNCLRGPQTPSCLDTAPTIAPQNFHVYRKGDSVIPVWFYDSNVSWKVAVFYGLVDQGEQHSVVLENNQSGNYEIKGLGDRDFSFTARFINGCNAGPYTTWVVDGNTEGWVLFR